MSFKMQDRVPLSRLQLLEEMSASMPRKLKIIQKKLPDDFFAIKGLPHSWETAGKGETRNQLYTQSHQRNLIDLGRLSQTRGVQLRKQIIRKESRTAREPQLQKQQDLILSVISTSRQMKRVLRKHSLQLKKENNSNLGNTGNTGNTLNTLNKLQGYRVELPPLLMRKGVTGAF